MTPTQGVHPRVPPKSLKKGRAVGQRRNVSSFSTISYTVPSPRQCFKSVPRMTGDIVSKSSSASGEVALEKLKGQRKVTVAVERSAGGRGSRAEKSKGSRPDPASKGSL